MTVYLMFFIVDIHVKEFRKFRIDSTQTMNNLNSDVLQLYIYIYIYTYIYIYYISENSGHK